MVVCELESVLGHQESLRPKNHAADRHAADRDVDLRRLEKRPFEGWLPLQRTASVQAQQTYAHIGIAMLKYHSCFAKMKKRRHRHTACGELPPSNPSRSLPMSVIGWRIPEVVSPTFPAK